MIHEFFASKKNVALQFSGGKDSLAAFYLMEPYWKQLTLMWGDTGDADSFTRDLVGELAVHCKELIIVKSNQKDHVEAFGPPTDLLPVWDSMYGNMLDASRKYRLQTPFECCSANLWEPMQKAAKEEGFDGIIRGQRRSEAKKSPISSGYTENGVEYYFPLQEWSRDQVLAYLDERGIRLPKNYDYFDSSSDCLTCTAYLSDNAGKRQYLKDYYPSALAVRKTRLDYITRAVAVELRHLHEAQ